MNTFCTFFTHTLTILKALHWWWTITMTETLLTTYFCPKPIKIWNTLAACSSRYILLTFTLTSNDGTYQINRTNSVAWTSYDKRLVNIFVRIKYVCKSERIILIMKIYKVIDFLNKPPNIFSFSHFVFGY